MNINHLSLRTAGLIAACAATLVPLTMATSPASAAEFQPNPAATIATSCGATGGVISIHYTNVGGLNTANFTTTVNGVVQNAVSIQPNDTADLAVAAADSAAAPVVISAPPALSIVTTVGPIACFDGSGTLTLDCTSGVPQLTAVATNIGKSTNVATFSLVGDPTSPEPATLAAAGAHTFSRTLVEDATYQATITWAHGGTDATLSGTAHCLPPPTTTTIPDPTTTTTIPDPTTTIPAAVALPTTGSSSSGIIVTASLLTLLGLIAVRVVRRPKLSR